MVLRMVVMMATTLDGRRIKSISGWQRLESMTVELKPLKKKLILITNEIILILNQFMLTLDCFQELLIDFVVSGTCVALMILRRKEIMLDRRKSLTTMRMMMM